MKNQSFMSSVGLAIILAGCFSMGFATPTLAAEAKPVVRQATAVAKRTLSALRLPKAAAARKPATPRFKVAKVAIDAPMLAAGTMPNGAMGVPTDPQAVGWNEIGLWTANPGTTVIDGHSELQGSVPGVFARLKELRVGDTLTVESVDGTHLTYVIRQVKMYKATDNFYDVFAPAPGTHLNLITCAGAWDNSIGTYAQRLVIFADLAA